MKKTENFFVISNYNVDPTPLTEYAKNFVVYDQSDNLSIIQSNKNKNDSRIFTFKNTGHNHIVFFKYIVDNFENLPKMVSFLKGNIIGRHVSLRYWERNYDNKHYTFLWEDDLFEDKPGIAYSLYSGHFIEVNNSWYVPNSRHRYFVDLNDLIQFFYDVKKLPSYVLFSPGGCYIVERERILRNPKSFYEGLIKIMEYTFFPSEVWMVERIMNIIFDSDWPLREYVFNKSELFRRIDKLEDLSYWTPKNRKIFRCIPNYLDYITGRSQKRHWASVSSNL